MMTESGVRALVDREVQRAGSRRQLALEWGVSPAMISDLMNGRRGPGPKILKHLKLRRVESVSFEASTSGR